jgi:hypothetical protein
VGDLDAVEEQFPVPGGTFVDYALKIDDAPVVFVEAKPLQEALDDPKWIAQTINYAHNQDVDWCVLTNGAEWRCYKSTAKGRMEEKLLFHVRVADQDADRHLGLLARDGVPGALEKYSETVFTDRKVKGALERPPAEMLAGLVSLVRKLAPDLSRKEISASLARLSIRVEFTEVAPVEVKESRRKRPDKRAYDLSGLFRRCAASAGSIGLFNALDTAVLGISGDVARHVKKWYVRYEVGGKTCGSVVPLKSSLRAFVYLPPSELPGAVNQTLVRDVSGVGHYGVGDTEIRCADDSELDSVVAAMRASYEKVRGSA